MMNNENITVLTLVMNYLGVKEYPDYKVRNSEIRRIMNADKIVLDKIVKRVLQWFGHLTKMA